MDLGNKTMTQKVFEGIRDKHGPIDILVNNAALARSSSFLETELEAYEHTMRVNFLAQVQVTKVILPGMVQRSKGHIVNIVSQAGFFGSKLLGDYTASKHAFYGHNTVLRLEMMQSGKNISVTGVFPALIDTGLFKGATIRHENVIKILKTDDVTARIY